MSTTKQNNRSNYAQQQYQAHHHQKPVRVARKKETAERVADLVKLLDVCHLLYRNGCLIHHFLSSDSKPMVFVEPCALFKQLIIGNAVYITSRTRVGKIVQVECHVLINEVKLCWSEVVYKDPEKSE